MAKNLIIVALLTLNAVFGYALYERTIAAGDRSTQPKAGEAGDAHPVSIPAGAEAPRGLVAHDAAGNPPTDTVFDGSYLNLTADLRQLGFTDDLVRQIVLATMNRDHLLTMQTDVGGPYWKKSTRSRLDVINRELKWQADQRLTLVSVFGDEIVDDPMFEELFKPMNRTLPFLSWEKQIALYELEQRHDPRNTPGFREGTTEAAQEFRQSRQAVRNTIEQLLTPDEFFEYQLRESPAAKFMREMSDFEYTEQEFRDIYQMRAEQFDEFATGERPTREELRERRDAMQDRAKTYLGNERYEEYARSQDYFYRTLKSLGERYGNSESEIVAVYGETKSAREQIFALGTDDSLTGEERRARAEKIRDEMLQRISNIAGDETADSIKQNMRRLGIPVRNASPRRR